jgi:hypothetical protein
MTLLNAIEKEIKKLVGAAEPVETDQSWPVETEEYYEDTSVAVIYQPPEGALQDAWAPTADQVVPGYRGVEEHGVPYNASNNYVIPIAQADTIVSDEQASIDIEDQVQIDPVRVSVVDMPTPRGRENKVSTSSLTITRGTTVTIAPKSYRRSKLIIVVTGTDTVMISSDKQGAATQGFLVTSALGKFDIDTTQEIFAYAPTTLATDPVVYVLALTESSVDEHPV